MLLSLLTGSYCPNSGMAQPRLCPPGRSSAAGQTSCRPCNDSLCGGTAAPRLSLPAHRTSQTAACRPGTYRDDAREACVVCPVGWYLHNVLCLIAIPIHFHVESILCGVDTRTDKKLQKSKCKVGESVQQKIRK